MKSFITRFILITSIPVLQVVAPKSTSFKCDFKNCDHTAKNQVELWGHHIDEHLPADTEILGPSTQPSSPGHHSGQSPVLPGHCPADRHAMAGPSQNSHGHHPRSPGLTGHHPGSSPGNSPVDVHHPMSELDELRNQVILPPKRSKCPHCEKTLSKPGNVRRHVRTCHPEIV